MTKRRGRIDKTAEETDDLRRAKKGAAEWLSKRNPKGYYAIEFYVHVNGKLDHDRLEELGLNESELNDIKAAAEKEMQPPVTHLQDPFDIFENPRARAYA